MRPRSVRPVQAFAADDAGDVAVRLAVAGEDEGGDHGHARAPVS